MGRRHSYRACHINHHGSRSTSLTSKTPWPASPEAALHQRNAVRVPTAIERRSQTPWQVFISESDETWFFGAPCFQAKLDIS